MAATRLPLLGLGRRWEIRQQLLLKGVKGDDVFAGMRDGARGRPSGGCRASRDGAPAPPLQHRRLETLPNAQDTEPRGELENEPVEFEIEQDRQIPVICERCTFELVDDGLQQLEVLGVVAIE